VRTPVCDKFGIEFPLFAFSHCRDVVAAVSRAGGFGVLGALAYTPEELEIELAWIDDHVEGKPYGVDLVMPANYVGKGGVQPGADELRAMIPQEHWDFTDKILSEYGIPPLPEDYDERARAAGLGVDDQATRAVEISLKHDGVKLLVNALGPPPKDVVDTAHEHNVLVAALVGSKHHAEKQVAIGVDVIVAQGTEAGGHTGQRSTWPLLAEILTLTDRPVVAAGGIATGRAMAAALVAGAAGVWIGTALLSCPEGLNKPSARERIRAATGDETVHTRAFDVAEGVAWPERWPGRALVNDFSRQWHGREGELVDDEAARASVVEGRRTGNPATAPLYAGEAVGLVVTERSATDVVREMDADAEKALRTVPDLLS
jgi:nitronate monooxygenase